MPFGASSPRAGLLAGIAIPVAFALVHGLASITYRGSQIVPGVAITFLAARLTALIGQAWYGQVPVQFVQALPYMLTVVLPAGFIGRAIPPKAGGVPYVKER